MAKDQLQGKREKLAGMDGKLVCVFGWLIQHLFITFMSQFVDLFVQGNGKASHILEEELKSMSAISSRYPSLAKTPFYNE